MVEMELEKKARSTPWPPNARVENVEVEITMQAGMDFTGTGVIRYALEPHYHQLDDRNAAFDQLRKTLETDFKKALQIKSESLDSIEQQLFHELFQSSQQRLGPAFQKLEFKGTPLTVKLPVIDGRRAGDSVDISISKGEELDYGEFESVREKVKPKIPAKAKLYEHFNEFESKFRADFRGQLQNQKESLLQDRLERNEKFKKDLSGYWFGKGKNQQMNNSELEVTVKFNEDKTCELFLDYTSINRSAEITKVRDQIAFNGTWKIVNQHIIVNCKQTRWLSDKQLIRRPDQGDSTDYAEEILDKKNINFYFVYLPESLGMNFTNIFENNDKTELKTGNGRVLHTNFFFQLRKQNENFGKENM
jgi:hypothetical protein